MLFPPIKPSYNVFEAKPQSYDVLGDMTAGQHYTDSSALRSLDFSFKSLLNSSVKDNHDFETQGSVPLEDHSQAYSFHNRHTGAMEIQGFQDTSWQVSSLEEEAPPHDKSMILKDEKPYQSDLHKEDLIEASDKTEDDQVPSLGNKDHHTAVKFTGTHKDEKIFLSGVAAAFYSGGSLRLHGVLSCSSITKINEFLDERRDELHAGVPGKWLTIVLGKESSGKFLISSCMHIAERILP